MLFYVHRDHKDGEPGTATSTFTQLLLSSDIVQALLDELKSHTRDVTQTLVLARSSATALSPHGADPVVRTSVQNSCSITTAHQIVQTLSDS